MEPLIDPNGFPYFEKLPENFRVATIDDFHSKGLKKVGMQYLIKWVSKEYYEANTVRESLTAAYLKPFIADNRVFVKDQTNE